MKTFHLFLYRHLDEEEFRINTRKGNDVEMLVEATRNISGRLTDREDKASELDSGAVSG